MKPWKPNFRLPPGTQERKGGSGREEAISRFSLTALLSRHPHDLSGGEMQKVALACLLLRDLDTPVAG